MAGRCPYDRMQTHVAQSGGVRGYNRTNHQYVAKNKLQKGKLDREKIDPFIGASHFSDWLVCIQTAVYGDYRLRRGTEYGSK